MSEVQDGAVAPVATPPGTLPDGQTSEPVTTGETGTPEAKETTPDTPEKRESRYKRRLDKWKSEAAYWKGVAEARQSEGPSKPQPSPSVGSNEDPEPKRDQFDDYETYTRAVSRWEGRQEAKRVTKQERDRIENDSRTQRSQREQAQLHESFSKSLDKARDEIDDFDEVMSESEAPSTPDMNRAIMESEFAGKLLYYFAKHPEEAQRIAKLSPVRQIAEVGKVEDKVSKAAAPPKKPSSAPDPIKPVGGTSATVEKDPNKMTDAEFAAWRKSHKKRR